MVSKRHSPESAADGEAGQGVPGTPPVRPQVEFDGLPRSSRMVDLIQDRCAVLGAAVPAIERCHVSLHAQQASDGRVCSDALRVEVTARGKRMLIEQPCTTQEESHMETLVSRAFEALHRRLESNGDRK